LADACDNEGDVTENVVELPAEAMLVDRLKVEGIWKKELELAECTDGCDGDDEGDSDVVGCGWELVPSTSPLSDVFVVRLVPDPLRMRGLRRISRALDGIGGGRPSFSRSAQSLPFAFCAWIRRVFLLFSNCIRAVSCSVSIVLNLNRTRSNELA
jgi:hypothetical protein